MGMPKANIKALLPAGKPDSHWNFAVRTLRPLVRILLRFGFSCDDMTQMIRKIAVDTALEKDEFKSNGKTGTSHAAVTTGLSRKEVKKMRELDDMRELMDARQGNRATRVLDGWMNDPRFRDEEGQPKNRLPLRSNVGVSFHQLVREYGGDIPPRAILSALLKHGAVREGRNHVELLSGYYVPVNDSHEFENNIGIITKNMISTAEYNLRIGQEDTRFLREWFQRYVPEDKAPEAHKLIREEAIKFGKNVDISLAKLAHSKKLANTQYVRLGMGIFYYADNKPEDIKEL